MGQLRADRDPVAALRGSRDSPRPGSNARRPLACQRAPDALALQRRAGNQAVASLLTVSRNRTSTDTAPVVMREARRRGPSGFRQRAYVVRDPSIGVGGSILVSNLAALKRDLMGTSNPGAWSLVIAIHGAEDRIAAQSPPNWQRNAIFYRQADITRLFSSDSDWVSWRDQFGPRYVALVACQVSVDFEQTVISNLTRHGAGSGGSSGPSQAAQGLGTGCKPLTDVLDLGVRSRQQLRGLNPDARSEFMTQLRQLNRRYGYYGTPPVADDEALIYYFDVAPRARWVRVVVGLRQPDGSARAVTPHIPFWNRAQGTHAGRFRRVCTQGVSTLREHRPTVPPPVRSD